MALPKTLVVSPNRRNQVVGNQETYQKEQEEESQDEDLDILAKSLVKSVLSGGVI